MRTRPVLVVVALTTAVFTVAITRPTSAQPAIKSGPAPATTKAPAETKAPYAQIAGAASCSGRACHGSALPESKPIQQNEFSTWVVHDKHARAYASLLSERGQRIGKNLGIVAHEDSRCLACHVTGELASKDTPREFWHLREEGVSCEACHGPAKGPNGGWLDAHTTKRWREGEAAAVAKRFADHSMSDLSDLTVQAKTCAGCHVGGPAEPERGIPALDLNHDLMAAGHPRLMFELTAYRANEPPHWNVAKYKNDPGYEAKSWAIGQVASAQASVALLGYRAEQAKEKHAPWPEFAESDCFTCHGDFDNKSWRRTEAYYKGRRPGNLPYSRWYSALLPALAPVAKETDKPVVNGFAALEHAMSRTGTDPAKIAAEVKALQPKLAALLTSVAGARYDEMARAELLKVLKSPNADVKAMRWEQLTQLALALAALEGKPTAQTTELFKALAFPPGYESPAFSLGGGCVKAAEEALKAR